MICVDRNPDYREKLHWNMQRNIVLSIQILGQGFDDSEKHSTAMCMCTTQHIDNYIIKRLTTGQWPGCLCKSLRGWPGRLLVQIINRLLMQISNHIEGPPMFFTGRWLSWTTPKQWTFRISSFTPAANWTRFLHVFTMLSKTMTIPGRVLVNTRVFPDKLVNLLT